MTPKQLERALRGFHQLRPFRRFVIELESGRDVSIVHPFNNAVAVDDVFGSSGWIADGMAA
jgi:hypothetical protein